MIVLRGGPFTAGLLAWTGVHLLLAVITLGTSSLPLLDLLAALLVSGLAVGAAGAGVRDRVPAPPALTAALTAAGPAAAVVVMATVRPADLTGYANWWPSAVGPLVAALVLRRRPRHAVATVVVSAAVLWVGLAVRSSEASWPSGAVLLTTAMLVWLVGAALAARLLDRSEQDLLDSTRQGARAQARLREVRDRGRERGLRHDLLERDAVGVLTAVADPSLPLDAGLRARAAATEEHLRRELRGRALLDDRVRLAAAGARGRGVVVDVLDDADAAGAPGAAGAVLARDLVTRAARAAVDGDLTARRPPGGGVLLTLVHAAGETSLRRVAAALAPPPPAGAGLPAGFALDVDLDLGAGTADGEGGVGPGSGGAGSGGAGGGAGGGVLVAQLREER